VKYGIYAYEDTNVTTSWIFKLDEGAEEEGYVKIGESRTMAEAKKLLKEIGIFKCNR